jgi:broad specificity phosphatase PhoE
MKSPERRSLREIIEDAVKGEPSVYLVRHGSTVMNRGGAGKDLIRGWADVAFSPGGYLELKKIDGRWRAMEEENYDAEGVERAVTGS